MSNIYRCLYTKLISIKVDVEKPFIFYWYGAQMQRDGQMQVRSEHCTETEM